MSGYRRTRELQCGNGLFKPCEHDGTITGRALQDSVAVSAEAPGLLSLHTKKAGLPPGLSVSCRPASPYVCGFFRLNVLLILSNSSIFAPFLRMIAACCATDSVLFHAQ